MSTRVSRTADKERGRRVPAAEARDRILAAAEALLGTRRFRDLTVEDLMAEAGLARTVFYRHFDGLPAVVIALVARIGERVAEILGGAEPTLRETLAGSVELYARHGHLLRAVDEAVRVDDAVAQTWRGLTEAVYARSAELCGGGAAGYERARALNLMNAAYLLDAFDRVDRETQLATLLTVWEAATAGR